MITYQIEKLEDCLEDIKKLVDLHWEESGFFKDKVTFAPDYTGYLHLDSNDGLLVVTVRDDHTLIGYSIDFIFRHMHYSNNKTAIKDLLFIVSKYRRGRVVTKLLLTVLETLKGMGVTIHLSNSRPNNGYERLLVALGYTHTENSYSIIIGEQ